MPVIAGNNHVHLFPYAREGMLKSLCLSVSPQKESKTFTVVLVRAVPEHLTDQTRFIAISAALPCYQRISELPQRL